VEKETNSRQIKTRLPLRVWLIAVGAGAALFGIILFATWDTGNLIIDARMSGIVTDKHFIDRPEQQITFGERGLRADSIDGDHILVVQVRERSGNMRTFEVWVDREMFDNTNVGDAFDVGPYLVRTLE
jgi:hypothetical protein